MLTRDDTALVLIDVQDRLAQAMSGKERLFDNLEKLVLGAVTLGLPVIWTEQAPGKLGPTIERLAGPLSQVTTPISKSSFSCCSDAGFMDRVLETSRSKFLLAGIEAHVCVYQTAFDMIGMGHIVSVVSDAVSSRAPENKAVALDRIRAAGALITSVEMALFEILKTANDEKFREVSRILK